MVSLSIILEDLEDGTVQIKSRSTRPLPEDMSLASPAELVMLEVSGRMVETYNVDDKGVINFGLLKAEVPKLIV